MKQNAKETTYREIENYINLMFPEIVGIYLDSCKKCNKAYTASCELENGVIIRVNFDTFQEFKDKFSDIGLEGTSDE